MALKIAMLLVLAVASLWLYVRFAPLDPATYHLELSRIEAKDARGQFSVGAGGDIAAVDVSGVGPARVQQVVEATPRTGLLAGSLTREDGGVARASYVTRSRFWGFPDVTVIELERRDAGLMLSMTGRLVYGVEDMGVNEARIRGWLDQLGLKP